MWQVDHNSMTGRSAVTKIWCDLGTENTAVRAPRASISLLIPAKVADAWPRPLQRQWRSSSRRPSTRTIDGRLPFVEQFPSCFKQTKGEERVSAMMRKLAPVAVASAAVLASACSNNEGGYRAGAGGATEACHHFATLNGAKPPAELKKRVHGGDGGVEAELQWEHEKGTAEVICSMKLDRGRWWLIDYQAFGHDNSP
jgi:hypothetical protein